MSSYKVYNSDSTNVMEILHAVDLSIANLVRDLTASLNKEDPNFTNIKTKVAHVLVETLRRETGIDSPRLALVSFIGVDGVSFSYFTGGKDKTFAVYSNDTLSSSSYAWYLQSVSSFEVGKLIGEVKIEDCPTASMNAEFFLQALSMKNGYISIGRRWCSESEAEMLVIRTVFFKELKGVVSLGFPIDDNTDLISRRICKEEVKEKTTFMPIQKKAIISGDDNGDSNEEEMVLPEDAQCFSRFHEKVKDSYISVFSVTMVVPFVISTYSIAYAIQLAWKKRELDIELNKYKKVAQEAERKVANKSVAVANASHDIRSALACIMALIEVSCSSVVHGSEVETNLRKMNTCARDLLDLLSSILDASKIEAGMMQLEERKFDLSKLLEDVVDLYHPLGMKKGVDVVLDPCDGSLYEYPIVKGDAIKLKQVISNLLSNAVKFTTEGHVSIRACARKRVVQDSTVNGVRRNTFSTSFLSFWKTKKMVDPDRDESRNIVKQDPTCVEYIFEVDDTGKGIPKDKWNVVFDNFVQVKETDASVGTGLGLAIVRSLVQLMGGDIEILEKPFDQRGTCFKFNIFLANYASRTNVFPSKRVPDEDFKAKLPHINDDLARSVGSDILNTSLVLLFIKNEGRREIIHRFLKSIDIMVVEVKEAKDLLPFLENPSYNIPDIGHQSPINFVLLIIDASAGNFSELKDCVEVSKKNLSMKTNCSVVWLETRACGGSGEGENIIPLVDYVTSKPLHGYRLFEVIRLLPEFHLSHEIIEASESEVQDPLSLGSISSSESPLVGKRVLIVEDTMMLMLVATKIVTKMGAIVDKCNNGHEAVDHVIASFLNHLPYDFILMDCKMPVLDGFEATKMIRKEESAYDVHIPIIALTANETGEELQRTFEVGMDYVLQKPLEAENLMIAIKFIERQNMIMKLQE
ncbi:uncharacterized protein [Phyllobates terribilis]|uniref:uncharacterized protein n=1 Tax=Phyllobates terribilis TaxID=111132 RepID=UPI003CCAFB90